MSCHASKSMRVRRLATVLFVVCTKCVFTPLSAEAAVDRRVVHSAGTLSFVREVRQLSSERASLSQPVQLRGVVTVLSGWKNSFFLQDSTSGISVDRLDQNPELKAGDKVIVSGTTAPGAFAPIVLSRSVRIVGRTTLPAARLHKLSELMGGTADSQWLAMRGKVRSAEIKTVWDRAVLVLKLDIGSDIIVEVHVQDFAPEAISQLPGAAVTIRGVCGTIFNDRRQLIGLRLFASSLQDIKFEKSPPADPFDLPTRQLGDLFQFSDSAKVADQIKVSGIVSWSKPGEGFYLQDGSQAAYVESPTSTRIEQGARVEAVGYPIRTLGSPSLRASLVRAAPGDVQLQAAPHSAAEIITVRDGFLATPYAAQLVTLEGRLLDEVPGASAYTLLLKDGSLVFRAVLPTSSLHLGVQRGSMVRVTGVCSVRLDETGEASSFGILMRSPADLLVTRRPPWWNTGHALQSLGVLCACLLGIAVWAVASRRRAELKALVLTDPLTSLYNRRGFELLAEKHTQIAQRRHADLLLFYLDVDRFKQINDTFGHREGDKALCQVALALQNAFRESDIIGRLGGDEFAVIAIDASAESRSKLIVRIHEELEKFNEAAGQPFKIAISVGVVVCRRDDEERTLDALLSRADELMYEQKRNRAERTRQRPVISTATQ